MSKIRPLTEDEAKVLFGWVRIEDFMDDLRKRGLLEPPVDPLGAKVQSIIDDIAPACVDAMPRTEELRKSALLRFVKSLPVHGLKIVEADDA